MSTTIHCALAAILALGLAACGTPAVQYGQGAGTGTSADAEAGGFKLEPLTAVVAPGAPGDATNTRVGWRRDSETPLSLNLTLDFAPKAGGGAGAEGETADGGTAAPSLQKYTEEMTNIILIFNANGQNDPALSAEIVKALPEVAAEAAKVGAGE